MESARELCRGEECQAILRTRFPLLCTACSHTLHKRYPHHRRFLESTVGEGQPQSCEERASHIALRDDNNPADRSPLAKEGAATAMAYSDQAGEYRQRDQKAIDSEFVCGQSGCQSRAQTTPLLLNRWRSRREEDSSSLEPPTSVASRRGQMRSRDQPVGREELSAGNQARYCEVRAVRSSRTKLQPVHSRYRILLQHLQANPGQSLLDAYYATGIPRSTVLGTKAIAELKLVDSSLFSDVVQNSGGKVKIGRLNRMCSEVLARPELAHRVAEMRLRGQLLPFLTGQSRQNTDTSSTERKGEQIQSEFDDEIDDRSLPH